MARASDSISPTAHYTGYTWYHHGLSHPALVTPQGRLLHASLAPLRGLSQLGGAPSLQGLLLARHQCIDLLLHRAILEGRVSQIIEVAAGLSPRGWRFKKHYGDKLRYIEADLPDMARRKSGLLSAAGLSSAGHEVVPLDALADEGPLSLAQLARSLDAGQGTAIITEGLLNYFDEAHVRGIWARFAKVLGGFAHGLYLSDIHLAHTNRGAAVSVFKTLLSAFVKGRVHFHFAAEAQACAALREAGFTQAQLHAPRQFAADLRLPLTPGAEMVRIIEARTGPQA
jgi:O-methyltransferase involved in polyketide biosynthesis